jgi:hypothetical protein
VICTYSAAAYESAFKDTYGNLLPGAERADWLQELVVPNGSVWGSLKAYPKCAAMALCNSYSFGINAEYDIGGAMWALALRGGRRVLDGSATLYAMRQDDPAGDPDQGVQVGQGVSDAAGVVVVGGYAVNNEAYFVLTDDPSTFHA